MATRHDTSTTPPAGHRFRLMCAGGCGDIGADGIAWPSGAYTLDFHEPHVHTEQWSSRTAILNFHAGCHIAWIDPIDPKEDQ